MTTTRDPHAEANCECYQMYKHAWWELGYRKDGEKRKRNQYATTCVVCGHALGPGEGTIQCNEKKRIWTSCCAPPA